MENFRDSQIAHGGREPAMVGRVAPRAPRLPTVIFKKRNRSLPTHAKVLVRWPPPHL
jgi:hypothetical protein